MIEILELSKTKETVIDSKGIGDSRKKLIRQGGRTIRCGWPLACLGPLPSSFSEAILSFAFKSILVRLVVLHHLIL